MNPARPVTLTDFVAASYRYLRLAIVVVLLTLGASLLIERVGRDCRLGSVSAYYYTPVHPVFIGALVALGVVLIALRGSDAVEDNLFNVAGALAPIVALVPTERPSDVCRENEVVVDVDALVSNNVPALVVGVVVAIAIAAFVAWRQGKLRRMDLPRSTVVGLAISVALLAIGLIWYLSFQDSFRRWAHGTTAITMFVFIWIAVAVNAGWPARLLRAVYRTLDEPLPSSLTSPTDRHLRYRRWYRAVGVLMPVAAAAILVLVPSDVSVFWLEVVEIALFVAFWTLQTFEAWETGLTSDVSPVPANRR